jgi:hypothetical protein
MVRQEGQTDGEAGPGGPVVKKEKVKKVKVKKEKVATEKVKDVKPTKEELGRQDAKKSSAGAGKKGAP